MSLTPSKYSGAARGASPPAWRGGDGSHVASFQNRWPQHGAGSSSLAAGGSLTQEAVPHLAVATKDEALVLIAGSQVVMRQVSPSAVSRRVHACNQVLPSAAQRAC